MTQVIVQFGGTITNAQNLSLSGSGTALDIFGTVHAEGLQTAEDDTILTNTIWPLAVSSSTSIVEPGGSVLVTEGDLAVNGTLLVLGGTVTTAAGVDISGSGTMTISNGTVTVGVPAQPNAFEVSTFNMTGGLLILGRAFDPNIESMTGGTIQFTTTDSNFAIPQFTYANLILSGNLPMILNAGNGDTVINGNLSITGTTKAEVHAPFTAHSLTLGGVTVSAGTWGGPGSGAAHINATYFTPAVPGDFIIIPNHPPVAANFSVTVNVNSFKMNISDLLTNVTDVDGDTIALTGFTTSTNGVVIFTNATLFQYRNTNNVNDQFSYTVNDGFGGSANGVVTVIFNPFGNGNPQTGQSWHRHPRRRRGAPDLLRNSHLSLRHPALHQSRHLDHHPDHQCPQQRRLQLRRHLQRPRHPAILRLLPPHLDSVTGARSTAR